MVVRSLFTLLFSVMLSCVSAQLTESDKLRWGYRAGVNGSWITGNVERLLVNANLDVSHIGRTVGVKSSNSYLYGTIYQRETENDIFSRNFFYLNPRKRFYPYVMAWLQNSRRQQIDFRYQVGTGVSFELMQKKVNQLKLSGTITYEETRYGGTTFFIEPKDRNENRVRNVRGTVRVLGHHQLPKSKVELNYETWYQPSFNDANNWRYYLNAVLAIPVSKYLSLRSTLLYTHESIVLTDIKRDDKIMMFGVSVSNF